MNVHTRVRLVILGLVLSISFGLNECKKLDGYKFPLYSTPFCPRNESEWNKRSSVLNCNRTNGYTCLPNENFTELLEFCYSQPWILIEEGSCLYLERKGSYVDSYSCRHFIQGCHNTSYLSNNIFENPTCISIGNGCFLDEKSCKSSSKTTHRLETAEREKDGWLWVVLLIGIVVFVVCFSSVVLYLYCKKRICKSIPVRENETDPEEKELLNNRESQTDRDIFDQWKQEDSCFFSTKACEEVETNINGGWTPLMLAAGNDTQESGDNNFGESGQTKKDQKSKRRDETVQMLMLNGADINLCSENGTSPFYIACQNGQDSTVKLLLSNGADPNLCMNDGTSPLYLACQNGQDSTVKLLLSNGADPNLCMNDGASPLYIACHNGHDSTVQLLLSNGADPNLCMDGGASPLYLACHNGPDSTVQLLLSNGANPNLCMSNGASPLYIACQNGHDSTVKLLLSNGADPNLCMNDGTSPLYLACHDGHDSTVQLLLSNGANPNLCMSNGASPLYIACDNRHESTVQLLLSNGADTNLRMNDGASPLYIACHNGHDSTVQLLLSNGADTNLCTNDGTSPLYIAYQNGHDSTVQILRGNGA